MFIPKKMIKRGFTLIELLVIIVILGVLAALIFGQFITSLKKGRDARRKADLNQIQKALEMYYEDNRHYPPAVDLFSGASLSEGTKIYMQKLPKDPISNGIYEYNANQGGSYFRLFSCIENSLDQGPGVSQTGYNGGPGNCGTGACTECRYTISSPNITPLPAK